jgi:hypothetical protein
VNNKTPLALKMGGKIYKKRLNDLIKKRGD